MKEELSGEHSPSEARLLYSTGWSNDVIVECAGHSGVNNVIVMSVNDVIVMSGWFQDLPQSRPYKLGLLGAGLESCHIIQ